MPSQTLACETKNRCKSTLQLQTRKLETISRLYKSFPLSTLQTDAIWARKKLAYLSCLNASFKSFQSEL